MRLLIIRHAVAVEPGTPGMSDDERPLTPAGAKRFKKAARGLARLEARPAALLSSPLPRAWQTAEIAAQAWGRLAPQEAPALVGGSLADLEDALRAYDAQATVVLVGHEPQVSGLLAEVLGSSASDRLAFRKGGAALVDVPGELAQGGTLLWFLPPKALRAIVG